jgi:hypothetical protein
MRKAIEFSVLVVLLISLHPIDAVAQLQCEVTNDPHEVLLSYDDLTNFARALDVMGGTADSITVLQREYLDKASPGLSEYVRANGIAAEDYLEAVREKKERYSALRVLPEQLASQEELVRTAFVGLKTVVPNTAFVPVYYFVGTGGAGLHAEPSEYGLMVAITESTSDLSVIRLVLVHETVHVQQALTIGIEEYMQIFGPKMSLLALAIREGSAEFLTYLSTGEYVKKEAYNYLIENERSLWQRFQSEMHERLPGDWMFSHPSDPEQPNDLGYVMGARIVEAFYDRAEDKRKAVQDILSITDHEDFLERTGYSLKFNGSK